MNLSTMSVLTSVNVGIQTLSFNHDGSVLGGGGNDGKVSFWNFNALRAVCTSRRSRRSSQDLIISSMIHSLRPCAAPVLSLDWFATQTSKEILLATTEESCVALWKWPMERMRVLTGHTARVRSVSWAPGEKKVIASGSDDRSVRLWCGETCALTTTLFGHVGHVRSVRWLCAPAVNASELVTASSDSTLRIWSTTHGQSTLVLKGHSQHVTCLAVVTDGGACGAANAGGAPLVTSGSWDRTVRLWDPRAGGAEVAVLRGCGARINAVAAGCGLVAAAFGDRFGNDCGVRLWDLRAAAPRPLRLAAGSAAHPTSATSVALCPGGQYMATADLLGQLVVWDLVDGEGRLALAMARQARLGAASPLAALEPETLAAVADAALGVWAA